MGLIAQLEGKLLTGHVCHIEHVLPLVWLALQ